ncbi:hypothetical protein GCM10009868_06900 [Terrabacter aerolatus]|uniref:Uncharacterized protein n=1 Tax=Terrabacter aerolatus TaxID=422442 RepID=A0A512D6K0_9MICO|nr:hypothetical protein TAE01_39130 [Terrabacter aerolatus]
MADRRGARGEREAPAEPDEREVALEREGADGIPHPRIALCWGHKGVAELWQVGTMVASSVRPTMDARHPPDLAPPDLTQESIACPP